MRDRILDATERLLGRLGYQKTTMDDIAIEAAIGRRTIYLHFAGKEAVALATNTEYGLSLGIMSRDVMKALSLAERIPSGLVHINEQTVDDEALVPFGGVGVSGTGSRLGGVEWNLDAFTETQWVTVSDQIFPRPL